MSSLRRIAQAVLLWGGVGSLSTAACAQEQPAPGAPPTLIVFITVDQMRADYFPRFASQLSGGLGRLYRGGAFFSDAHHDHAITETAPGHSVTMSGRFPAHTGIVANIYGVNDAQAPVIGGGGPGASPFRFRGSTLIDWLRVKDSRSRALSVSRKDRGAILPIGRAHQSAYWYATDGRFSTSTYYADTLPTWVNEFNARKIPQSYAGKWWTLLNEERDYSEPDSVLNESDGEDFVFPHPFPSEPAQAARIFANYPAMDSLTAQFALQGLVSTGIGRGPQTDILAVSFSTTDAVGHRFGPDSRELHDQILRLDKYLGAFIDSLYKVRDSSSIAIALTADHGVAPIPEVRASREHVPVERANISPVLVHARAMLRAAGVDTTAIRIEEGIVTLDHPAFVGNRLTADSMLRAVASDLKRVTGVARVDRVADLSRADTVTDMVARRWIHMLPADYAADLVFSLAPYAYYSSVTGATHGTPNAHDSNVPVLFYGRWFIPGKYTQPALVADMAPTLAAIASVKPIERIDGRVRSEALRTKSP